MRLWIVGPPGSGKSILADRLGALLSCPVVHLDEIHWLPGWTMTLSRCRGARPAS
jgi:adenylate kinase family enzyme